MKRCNKCKTEKPESEFPKDSTRKCGLRPSCKRCYNVYMKERNDQKGGRQRILAMVDLARLPTPEFKYCWGCATTKPGSEFHADRWQRDSLTSRCKLCIKARDAGKQTGQGSKQAEYARRTAANAMKHERDACGIRPNRTGFGWVYRACSVDLPGLVKIGYSVNPDKRIRNQAFSVSRLDIADKFKAGVVAETYLHAQLTRSGLRVRNEWFTWNETAEELWDAEKTHWSQLAFLE